MIFIIKGLNMVVIWIKYILVSSKDWVWGNRCSATCYFVQNTWLSRHDIAIVKNADAIMSHEKTDGKINYLLWRWHYICLSRAAKYGKNLKGKWKHSKREMLYKFKLWSEIPRPMKHFQFSREDYKYILTWSEAYGGLTYGLSEVVLLGLCIRSA